MIVVVLIGISAAMVAPTMMRSMAISRATRCQHDFARMLRGARSEAIGTGRAQLVDIVYSATDVQMFVYTGDSSSCLRAAWPGIAGVMAPRDRVWQSDYDSGNTGVIVTVAATGFPQPRQICFEPDGDRFTRPNAVGVFTRDPGVVTITLARHESGLTGIDVPRRIIVPQFGTPRVVR